VCGVFVFNVHLRSIFPSFLVSLLLLFPFNASSAAGVCQNLQCINTKLSLSEIDFLDAEDQTNVFLSKVKNKDKRYELFKDNRNIRRYYPFCERIVFAGPKSLEIYQLDKFAKSGMQDSTIIRLMINAKGDYPKIKPKTLKCLNKTSLSPRLKATLKNIKILKMGGDLSVAKILELYLDGFDEDLLSRRVATSHEKYKYKFLKKKQRKWMRSIGLSNRLINMVSYSWLFSVGPKGHTVYDVYLKCNKNKNCSNSIINKINKHTYAYKEFNMFERKMLREIGIKDKIVDVMINSTELAEAREFESVLEKTKSVDLAYEKKFEEFENKKEKMAKAFLAQQQVQRQQLLSRNGAGNKDSMLVGVAKQAGKCLAGQAVKTKACSKLPWPISMGCNALTDNLTDC
jgi:hypothetical protein